MNCTVPEPDESGKKCIHCGQAIGDWGDNGMWVHLERDYHGNDVRRTESPSARTTGIVRHNC